MKVHYDNTFTSHHPVNKSRIDLSKHVILLLFFPYPFVIGRQRNQQQRCQGWQKNIGYKEKESPDLSIYNDTALFYHHQNMKGVCE